MIRVLLQRILELEYIGTLPSYDTFCTAMRIRENKLTLQNIKSSSRLYVNNKNKNQNNKPNLPVGEISNEAKGKGDQKRTIRNRNKLENVTIVGKLVV